MLINISNHPSRFWKKKQLDAASEYGKIVDVDFPPVSPEWDETQVKAVGDKYVNKCVELIGDERGRNAVHVMGELTLCFYMVNKLQSMGVTCVASTSQRQVNYTDHKKLSGFRFVKFRRYFT